MDLFIFLSKEDVLDLPIMPNSYGITLNVSKRHGIGRGESQWGGHERSPLIQAKDIGTRGPRFESYWG